MGWLAQIGQPLDHDVSISRHIAKMIEDGELDEESNLQKAQVAGSTKPVATPVSDGRGMGRGNWSALLTHAQRL